VCVYGISSLTSFAAPQRWPGLALEHNPVHQQAHRALADHYEKKGQPDQAAPHRRYSATGL
jgi:hypothetical protein